MRLHDLENDSRPVAEPRRVRDSRARQTGRAIGRLSQQEGQTFPCPVETQRRIQSRIRFWAKRSGERRCETRGFLRPGAAWQMSKVRRTRVRVRNELYLREFGRPEQDVRLSIGHSHPATISGPRANEETPRDRQNRFAGTFYFPQGQTVQSISRGDRKKRCWF